MYRRALAFQMYDIIKWGTTIFRNITYHDNITLCYVHSRIRKTRNAQQSPVVTE